MADNQTPIAGSAPARNISQQMSGEATPQVAWPPSEFADLPGLHPITDDPIRGYFILLAPTRGWALVKVGFTANLRQRLRAHVTHGAGGDVIGSVPGSRRLEGDFHFLGRYAGIIKNCSEYFNLTAQLDFAITSAIRAAKNGRPSDAALRALNKAHEGYFRSHGVRIKSRYQEGAV